MKPTLDIAVVMSLLVLANIAVFIWGAATGISEGQSQACSALCGDNWKWQERCVCLIEVRGER